MNKPIITHGEMVKMLVKSGEQLVEEFTPLKADVNHMTLGIAGEAGEIVDAVKKFIIYGRDIDRTNLVEELGDMEFYLEGLRQALGITRDETIVGNMMKLNIRYQGFRYSDEQAITRADKLEKETNE